MAPPDLAASPRLRLWPPAALNNVAAPLNGTAWREGNQLVLLGWRLARQDVAASCSCGSLPLGSGQWDLDNLPGPTGRGPRASEAWRQTEVKRRIVPGLTIGTPVPRYL
jgi:hypothetical protein